MKMTKRQIVQVTILLLGCLLAELNFTLLSPALPVIMNEMNVGETDVQWIMSIYSLVEAVVIPLNAFFLGRFTTRRLFVGSYVMFAAGAAVSAACPSFWILIVGRILQAIATGVVITMSSTLVLLTVPRSSRGKMMGLIGLVVSFAPAIGAPAAGGLVDAIGWRALLVAVAVIAAVLAAVGAMVVENRDGFERTSFDVPSIALSCTGMVSLLYGLSNVTKSDTPWIPLLLMVVGAVILAIFAQRQFNLKIPMLRLETLRAPQFRHAVTICFLMEASLLSVDVLLPLLMENALGATPTTTGIAMMPAALIGAATGFIAGKLFDKYGVRRVAVPGMALLFAPALFMCFIGLGASIALVAALYAVETLGWQLVSTPVNTWGMNALPDKILQHGTAVLDTLMQVGASFGTATIVSLTALAPGIDGYRFGFMGCAVLLIPVGVLVFTKLKDE